MFHSQGQRTRSSNFDEEAAVALERRHAEESCQKILALANRALRQKNAAQSDPNQ